MKAFLKKYKWPLLLLTADVLVVIGCIVGRWLSGRMLESDTVCLFLLLGGKCLTCGGTHFVRSLLTGQIVEAFHHNEFLFITTAYLALSLLLAHPAVLLKAKWAQKLLRWMYSIPSLILFLTGMTVFAVVRNLPLIARVVEFLTDRVF